MRIGRPGWWRRAVLSPARRVDKPRLAPRRGRLLRRLGGPVAVLAGVSLLSLSLGADLAGASAAHAPADASAARSLAGAATAGKVTIYPGIDHPEGITAGPDGALWFTSSNNSIGRITTSGKISGYTGSGIDLPGSITAGPDGALWFTNFGNGSIGRITTTVTPAISGSTPTSGAAGSTVTITGQNLSKATGVAFDGTPATILSDTATQIVAEVPTGAATGRITVTIPAGVAHSYANFTVT